MSDAHSLQEEDGFHEIQLNGKQLVFLGMTTTLVSVVIFLCGVLVGRGVKPIEPVAEAATQQTALAEPAAATPVADTPAPAPEPVAASTPAPAPAEPPPPAEHETAPAAVPPPATIAPAPKPEPKAQAAAKPAEDLSYYDTLAKGSGKKNAAKKAETAATPAPAAVTKTAEPVAEAAAAPVATATSAPAAHAGGAIAVQVAALASKSDAEAIARRLSGKGYAAYVLTADAGAKPVFKVRVGNYASADEAQRVSRRLRQEEKLQPWVIR